MEKVWTAVKTLVASAAHLFVGFMVNLLSSSFPVQSAFC